MNVQEIIFLAAAAGVALLLWRWLNPPRRIVIDDRGILDRSLRMGWIRWHDIEGAYQPTSVDDTLSLRLHPDRRAARRLRRARRAGADADQGVVDVYVNLSGTDVSALEILQLIVAKNGCH
jgi:hypothetical protein